MRIREILFQNFRSFRGERRISFVDPQTDAVRPLSVLAGSNGSGKTTILDAIEALLAFVLKPDEPSAMILEILDTGLIHLILELSPNEVDILSEFAYLRLDNTTRLLHIAVGRKDLAPTPFEGDSFCLFYQPGATKRPWDRKETPLVDNLRQKAMLASSIEGELYGGLLYFSHDRRLGISQGGPILPPTEEPRWLFRFSPTDRWQDSLEQLWVWHNYLDLERDAQERTRLKPFVASVEEILGPGRPIAIREGRVRVPVQWHGENGRSPAVRLDQLPSGEQQVLLLFGELARRRRPDAVIAIDEVENSLHPTLQRLVMWNLHRIAREWNAQVIVATHSLEVINSVRGGAFINLDYPEDRFDLPGPGDKEEAAQ